MANGVEHALARMEDAVRLMQENRVSLPPSRGEFDGLLRRVEALEALAKVTAAETITKAMSKRGGW